MKALHKIASLVLILTLTNISYIKSQEGTRASDENASGKIMIIPFEPFMYMSEIDKKINEETNWKQEQIKEYFRKQLDVQLMLKLKSKSQAISFYLDTLKMKKDLEYIYQSRSLNYESIESSGKKNTTQKPTSNIKNGQLTVEMNFDKKHMKTKINNPNLLLFLNKKYKSEYFIFINELDLKYNLEAYDLKTDTYQRFANVHYTIIDKNQKVLISGIAEQILPSLENNPKVIVEKTIIPIAEYITSQFYLYTSQP